MNIRPVIGARVRVLGNTGALYAAGREGVVTAHHVDGRAFWVQCGAVNGVREFAFVCDPVNVELVAARVPAGGPPMKETP